MHIPDGYLSPSTCAVLYAGSLPFWTVALRRVERLLHTRLVPILALFSAFSFVVMMFNLPLPGGTSGHAVGVGIGSVVLGPWGSMLAISIALFIQALFFGDGGITAFGANCFNMAIVGSLVAHATYRGISGGSPVTAYRRVVAAAAAGYLAINAAALLAGIEFGLQPMLFRDESNVPLYAPYPLGIAVTAMMLGHLTLAGFAEAALTAGIVRHLQRADPSLLALAGSAGTAADGTALAGLEARGAFRATRRLWAGLAVLMLLVPFGLLAAGVAWGEWSVAAFADPAGRARIAAASGGAPLPDRVPSGLERLSALWMAPIPRYAPGAVRNPAFGYVVSAMLGVGLVIALLLAVGAVRDRLRARRVRA